MRRLVQCMVVGLLAAVTVTGRAEDGGGRARAKAGATEALNITVDRSKVDLKQRRLEIVISGEAVKATIKVTDEADAVLDEHDIDVPEKSGSTPLVVTWSLSRNTAIAKIELRAIDADGGWVSHTLLPWSFSIPHQDVTFRTGSAQIDDAEKPKLEDSYKKIAAAIALQKTQGTPLRLFVAGHTDTVGKSADNLRLSRSRAQSIAAWFRARGLRISISHEGFGVNALLVVTAENVDEPKNRRADYILAFNEPSIATNGFKPMWQQMK